MNKILLIVGDATETVDTLYPFYRLQEDGFVPVVAAPEKRRYQMVLHEVKPGWTITKEWEGYTRLRQCKITSLYNLGSCGISCGAWHHETDSTLGRRTDLPDSRRQGHARCLKRPATCSLRLAP